MVVNAVRGLPASQGSARYHRSRSSASPIWTCAIVCITRRHRPVLPLLALIVAALSFACTSDQESALPGFYAEVAVEVEARPDDPLARFGGSGGRSVIRWWYAPDPARWRWEFETVGTVIDDGVLLTVVNGRDAWEYDDRANTYRRIIGRYASLGAEAMALPTFSAPVGPTHAGTLEALMAQWRERGDEPEVALGGEATLLGRRTQIVELRTAYSGVARAFVDPERMFIMRWVVDGSGGGQSYRAEVTALDYGAEITPDRFVFEPPPGAREADDQPAGSCSGSGGHTSGASFPAEPGLLQPAYAPAGYRITGMGAESSASDCERVAVWVLLEAEDRGSILLRQRLRPGGMPRLDRSWQAVDSSLDDAQSRRSRDGVLGLLWRAGDVVALLQADAATLDELVRIAESASLVPGSGR